ncbi:S6 family peptidase [Haemophilus influenzae]|uniref:S6 family peptidase n=1 Tax=Haemophilus influenzae TaxID=727 RepID=UPI000D22611D|nr:S6 family peptidase [Haemophilus influenzae]AVI95332.1 igA-specific serine endopeptidase autotransporter [Haemophilus influenzae]AVI97105.1 igA-specific serine endopeptidase autotransporter [Haemophilus influenzae]AVJ06065.1 igA-specific serine endopeptidase autotransporter [Haemophilus influenzae]AVJ07898.1 igA-specific serine endopeptidase autotransporter [Haemophilus influenzae]
MLNKKFKLSLITLSVIYALTPYTEAALVRDDVDYQIFRDFAENKGKFFVGATDLSVKNKQGQNIGNALSNVPMIDFSVADVNKRIATVVDPQYAVSVKHAKAEVHTFYYGQYNGHNDVADKENEYRVVEQNNYEPHKAWGASNLGRLEDYNMARFNKFVTEVAPIAPTDAGGGLDTYKDKNRFSSFVRVGAGRQLVYEKGAYHQEGNEKGYDLRDLSQAYRYAIAGTPYKDINIDQTMNTEGLIGFGHHNTHYSAEELKQALSQDALTNYGVLGDSGSPLFAFDKQKNQWVFLGTYDYWAGYGKKSWQEWNIYKKEFADKIKQHDNAGTIKGNGEHHWKTTGTNSHIGSTAVRLANNERDANNGQNVTFEDNGTLVLDQNINQGAGGLFFKGDYTVKGANSDITWLGAGIDVADGKKVVWQVKNPQGDKLAKIGKGALEINGTGVNQGELKVGDGTVILNQKADSNQKVQAFSQVGIVSGRGTLVLNSPDQINPNNLYFGFRGGRLDANGNDLTFEHIRNVDEGARVVNHNTSNVSTITLTGKSLITDPKGLSIHYIQNNDYDDDGYYGYYYRPRKPIPQGKDLYFKNYRYYALKPGGSVNSPMPENGVAENNDWVFMGYTEEKAKKNVMNHKNNQRISGFSGFFGEENGKGHNGALNLNFNGKSAQNRFLLTGGTNLNGKISVTQGNVLLSGRPTPHARDFVNKSSAYKDAHFSKNNEVVFEDDWINRTFKAAEITVNQSASLSSGRNVSNITANITATDNAKVNLGYKNGDEVCVRSDYTGYVTCTKDNLSDKALNSFDATQINGNVNLSQNAALTLGKAALWGQIQGQGNSRVSLNQHSKWHLTGDSQVQNLSLEDSHIHLNNASDAQSANKYHTLKINHLSGNGHFHYLTHLAKNLGDKVVVKESASGHYQLHVQDKTGEPNQEGLNLFDASSVRDRSRLSVSLANNHVDLGALRYTIKTENGITRLYNPYAENRRRVKPAPSPATNTASQAQKATQTDGAQIAEPQNIVVAPPSPQANQAEEAKRQQAQAEARRQQAEAERERVARQKAEEAKRQQETLARQQEEAKRQAAELLAKQKAAAEAQALAARQQAEAERKARELAERKKAEAERKAAELAKQKAEEASHQAKAQPKRRRRRAAPQNNVAIAQAQAEARRQQAEAERERVARQKAEEAKRQQETLARQQEEAKRQAAELLAKQKAAAEAQALAARQQAEAERKARELAERKKAEAERKAAELAKQKAEEASHQAKAQPKRRRRRAAPQNNVAIAQAQAEARRQQAEAERERVARQKAEEAKRQQETLARQQEEAKRQAAELLAKQKAAAEAQALAARRQAEAERKARELAEREKAEAERKAAELAKQKAEEASHQAKAQPKRRRRRAAPQNNVAIAQAQTEARRQQAEAERERVARQKAEEAKRQQETLARQQEEAKRQAAELLAKQKAAAEAQALAARRQAEAERKARELAEREKAEAERKAAELAKQKAEEASHQAKAQPKRRRRRAILPRPPAPVFSFDDYDAKDNSESSIGNLARVTPRMRRESIDDFEEIPLDVLEAAETSTNITDNIGKDIQEILDDESEDTDIEQLIDSLGQTVRLQPRTSRPIENMSQAGAISKNTNTALSDAMVSSQFILLDTGSSLVQQITQTELSANKENNVWVSNTTYDRHYSSTQYRQFSAKRSQIQIGIDHYLSKNTQVGTVLSYVRNSNVFDQASGKNTFVQANTYGKYYFDYGWYISGDIGVGQLRSQLQTQQKAKFNRIATQAGIMIGNRIDINRFEILPSIGVRYSYLSSIDYKLGSDSLKVDSISIKTALAKLDLAYQFNIGEFALKPILSMAYVINSGEGIVNIGGQNYRYKSDNQQQYSAGMALNYRNLTFNINGGAIKGRQLSNQKFLQIKMQVSF